MVDAARQLGEQAQQLVHAAVDQYTPLVEDAASKAQEAVEDAVNKAQAAVDLYIPVAKAAEDNFIQAALDAEETFFDNGGAEKVKAAAHDAEVEIKDALQAGSKAVASAVEDWKAEHPFPQRLPHHLRADGAGGMDGRHGVSAPPFSLPCLTCSGGAFLSFSICMFKCSFLPYFGPKLSVLLFADTGTLHTVFVTVIQEYHPGFDRQPEPPCDDASEASEANHSTWQEIRDYLDTHIAALVMLILVSCVGAFCWCACLCRVRNACVTAQLRRRARQYQVFEQDEQQKQKSALSELPSYDFSEVELGEIPPAYIVAVVVA